MSDDNSTAADGDADLRAEIVRLNKIVRALMDRAERSTNSRGSDFSVFQATVMLEEQVRSRTTELEAALRENEKFIRALRESEEKFRGLVNQSLIGIAIIEDGKFSYTNSKLQEMFGYSADEGRNLGPLDVVVESDRSRVAEHIRQRISGEADAGHYQVRGVRKNGELIDIEVYGNTLRIGGKRAVMSLVLDVTERTRTEHELLALQERLREQSVHDALTGLYNRRHLEEVLGREVVLAERQRHPVSLIFADLDHFKAVNDRYGHMAGDEVLRVFAGLIKRHARGSDICCRYGGEEFLLVLPAMAEASAVERAERLRSEMAAAPIPYGDLSVSVSVSLGVASFPRHGRSGDELIAAADRALYAAKAAGRDRVSVAEVPISP